MLSAPRHPLFYCAATFAEAAMDTGRTRHHGLDAALAANLAAVVPLIERAALE